MVNCVISPSSNVLATLNNSIARFGSLRCRATDARIVGSQYRWTRVLSGKVLSSLAASFSAPAVSPTLVLHSSPE